MAIANVVPLVSLAWRRRMICIPIKGRASSHAASTLEIVCVSSEIIVKPDMYSDAMEGKTSCNGLTHVSRRRQSATADKQK